MKDNSGFPWHGTRPSLNGMTASASGYTLSDFDFELPPELIAQHPAAERSASRLLDGRGPTPVDRVFRDLPSLLQPGDLLVFNNTRVIKARLYGAKQSGGAVEALVERVLPNHEVLAHMRASKSPKAGSVVRFADADHGFHCDERPSFHAETSSAARASQAAIEWMLVACLPPKPMAKAASGARRCASRARACRPASIAISPPG